MRKLKLSDWIAEHGFSYRAAADALGIDSAYLYRIANDMQLPGRETIIILKNAGISVKEYLEVKHGTR